MNREKILRTLALTVVIAALSLGVNAALQQTKAIPGQGRVIVFNVEAYEDSAFTIPLTNIDWGELEPGQTANKTIYLKNTGNKAATLTLTTEDWAPAAAESAITVTWNKQGAVIAAKSTASATITITISPSITGVEDFTYTTIIVANS